MTGPSSERTAADERPQAPWPKSEDDLLVVIREQLGRDHDYSSCPEAVALCAAAAFNYAAHVLGITGFQASYAELQALALTRGLDGPFGILNGENLLYPQYDLEAQAAKWVEEWRPSLAETARKKLAEINDEFPPHPDVRARWKEIAALEPSR